MNGPYVATLLQSDSDGLTISELLGSLPTDATSLFAAALLLGFFGLIVYFGRGSGSSNAAGPEAPESEIRDKRELSPSEGDPGP
jgi:hypothetical protein